jgi:hypothetical protein
MIDEYVPLDTAYNGEDEIRVHGITPAGKE